MFFGLGLSTVKEFDDCDLTMLSVLFFFDRVYFGGGVFDFWELRLSSIYVFESGMFMSIVELFMVRFKIVFAFFLAFCNNLFRWKELILLVLYVTFDILV